ncbi:MAG TPA: hypothetical protein VNT51_14405, partial [Miltoncostaeaceae bacterium]|nr:hypothetical protein [Miltoncostaeaceae bacterium]
MAEQAAPPSWRRPDPDGDRPPPYDAADSLVGLARTLRAAGVPAAPHRVHAAVAALEALDPRRRDDVYWAGRLTLCGTPDDLERYDRVFAAYFGDRPSGVLRRRPVMSPQVRLVATEAGGDSGGEGDGEPAESTTAAASGTEQLRHRDVSRLTAREREELRRLLASLRLPGEPRASRRRRPSPRGPVDDARTLRAWLRAGGEPARLRHHRTTPRPRRAARRRERVDGLLRGQPPALRPRRGPPRRGRSAGGCPRR